MCSGWGAATVQQSPSKASGMVVHAKRGLTKGQQGCDKDRCLRAIRRYQAMCLDRATRTKAVLVMRYWLILQEAIQAK